MQARHPSSAHSQQVALGKDWAKPGDLMLRYAYEFLPKGMLSRCRRLRAEPGPGAVGRCDARRRTWRRPTPQSMVVGPTGT
jgi:hypothetical protein